MEINKRVTAYGGIPIPDCVISMTPAIIACPLIENDDVILYSEQDLWSFVNETSDSSKHFSSEWYFNAASAFKCGVEKVTLTSSNC